MFRIQHDMEQTESRMCKWKDIKMAVKQHSARQRLSSSNTCSKAEYSKPESGNIDICISMGHAGIIIAKDMLPSRKTVLQKIVLMKMLRGLKDMIREMVEGCRWRNYVLSMWRLKPTVNEEENSIEEAVAVVCLSSSAFWWEGKRKIFKCPGWTCIFHLMRL